MKRTVITIATGKVLYINFAINLARSFHYWHVDTDIGFRIVTDRPELFPPDVGSKSTIVTVRPGELGDGFSSKLFLDRLAPDGQTLFIDGDCLIFGDLSPVFERFKGRSVSVVGGYVSSGEWFGDVATICKKFSVPHLPKFNGGLYYLEKGDVANSVYQRARDIEPQYDDIGFVRLRNKPNDEVIMALAMQLEGLVPIADDGTILSDPLACPGKYKINVETGEALLVNPPLPHIMHRSWYPFHKVSPLIVHFLGAHTEDFLYKTETAKLPLLLEKNLNVWNRLGILFNIEYPARIKIGFKKMFRPIYRMLFGSRKIQPSERV